MLRPLALALACAGLAGLALSRADAETARPAAANATGTGRAETDESLERTRAALAELCVEPRPSTSRGLVRAIELVSRRLRAAGWAVYPVERAVTLRVPRFARLRLFDDPGADSPADSSRVAHFDFDSIPTTEPAPFVAGGASGEWRGPIVHLGDSDAAARARLEEAGLELVGCVLVAADTEADECVRWAEAQGVGAILFHRPLMPLVVEALEASGDEIDFGPAHIDKEDAAPFVALRAAASIPCLPITRAEERRVRAALRVRRMRDADGTRRGIAVGPGPIEAEVRVDTEERAGVLRSIVALLPPTEAESANAREGVDALLDPDASPAGEDPVARATNQAATRQLALDGFDDPVLASVELEILLRAAERASTRRANQTSESDRPSGAAALRLELSDTGFGREALTTPAVMLAVPACEHWRGVTGLAHLFAQHDELLRSLDARAERLVDDWTNATGAPANEAGSPR